MYSDQAVLYLDINVFYVSVLLDVPTTHGKTISTQSALSGYIGSYEDIAIAFGWRLSVFIGANFCATVSKGNRFVFASYFLSSQYDIPSCQDHNPQNHSEITWFWRACSMIRMNIAPSAAQSYFPCVHHLLHRLLRACNYTSKPYHNAGTVPKTYYHPKGPAWC
jgi:hypothetical protein